MPNVLTQDLGNGLFSQQSSNAPAVETATARFEQIGAFRSDNVSVDTFASYQAVDANAPFAFIAGKSGKIVGVIGLCNVATLLSGSIAGVPFVNGAQLNTAKYGCILTAPPGNLVRKMYAEPVPFPALDGLSVAIDVTAPNPATVEVSFWLLVQWDPA
jgi:hypothetical protein